MGTTQEIRAAAVAGQFYPRDPAELRWLLESMLAEAAVRRPWSGSPKALIVPHAGYVYSGSIAASAYEPLKRLRGALRRVVLLGPTHHVAVNGLALPGAQAFDTPLGRIPVDAEAVARIQSMAQVTTNAAAHAYEHSLEVQLPFLQLVLGEFQLVPLAVGHATPEAVAEVIEALWGGPETLIIVSSDLSHYLPYELARKIDRRTCANILSRERLTSHEQACGAAPINGLLLAAGHHGLMPNLLDLRNSGDTAGDPSQVVGYAAFAFTQEVRHEP